MGVLQLFFHATSSNSLPSSSLLTWKPYERSSLAGVRSRRGIILGIRAGAVKGSKKTSKKPSDKKKSVKVSTTSKDDEDVEDGDKGTADSKGKSGAALETSDAKPADLAQAILSKKQTPNMLLVDDSLHDDHSTVAISPAKMEQLGLFGGDTVLLKGKKRKKHRCCGKCRRQCERYKNPNDKGYKIKFETSFG